MADKTNEAPDGYREALKSRVAEAWKNAVDNGYEDHLRAMNYAEVASDMIACDDAVAQMTRPLSDKCDDTVFDRLEQDIADILPEIMGEPA